MNERIRIGSFQGPIVDNGFDRNLDKVRQVMNQTREQGLDFLCFPETYLSGYSEQAVRESSIHLDDPRLLEFIRFSGSFDTVILVGLSEREGESIFNTQVVIHHGRLLGKYRKAMLTEEDKLHFAPGREFPVFDAKGIKFGVVICADTSYVEPALLLRWKGARLLFTPHYNDIPPQGIDTTDGKVTFWEHRTMVLNNQAALATLLKMVVVRSNVVIVRENHLGSGDAAIWDMNGEIVARGTPFTECVVTAEFCKEIFTRENWIDRREVPVELLDQIVGAARQYNCNKSKSN
jgi:predicted amidohydrolase